MVAVSPSSLTDRFHSSFTSPFPLRGMVWWKVKRLFTTSHAINEGRKSGSGKLKYYFPGGRQETKLKDFKWDTVKALHDGCCARVQQLIILRCEGRVLVSLVSERREKCPLIIKNSEVLNMYPWGGLRGVCVCVWAHAGVFWEKKDKRYNNCEMTSSSFKAEDNNIVSLMCQSVPSHGLRGIIILMWLQYDDGLY